MFHGGAKYSTERVKCPTELLNIPRTMHTNGQMFHKNAKCSMDNVKCFTEVLNIPQVKCPTEFLKYSVDNLKCSTEVLNVPWTMSNLPRRC